MAGVWAWEGAFCACKAKWYPTALAYYSYKTVELSKLLNPKFRICFFSLLMWSRSLLTDSKLVTFKISISSQFCRCLIVWTRTHRTASRSCLGPLNQMLPSLHFSNSPAPRFLQESWYPEEILGHLRKGSKSWHKGLFSPFQPLPQNMMPFSPNKTLLKDQGSPNLLSSSPTIFTRSPVSQH